MYKRILLKLSGESLAGETKTGLCADKLHEYGTQIRDLCNEAIQVGIVIGGGNIFRGVSGQQTGIDRVHGDQMGMLATCINALALATTLNSLGQPARVLTAIRMEPVGEFYTADKARQYLDKGIVTIFAGGTGNPLFTTDTGASLRAIEIGADVLFKGTRVDGIYDSDPEKNPRAKKYDTITYDEVVTQDLHVMDLTAIVMCRDAKLPLHVFNMDVVGNLSKVIHNAPIGTRVIS